MANFLEENSLDQDTTPEEKEPSLRDELEAAFEQEPTDEVRDGAKEAKSEAAETGEVRDARGRFAAKAKADAAEAAADPAAAQNNQAQNNQAPGPQDPKDIKPPASWTPAAREEWASLSPRVKAEVQRREWEAQKVVQDSASARQFISAFENVVRPYEMFIRAENSNPLQAVQNLMRTAADLRVGTPLAKANLVASMVRDYSIDPVILDKALDLVLNGRGQGAEGHQPQGQQQFRDPRVDQLLAQQQRQQQEAEQRTQTEARQTLSKFAESHEFYNDVATDMADIVDIKGKRGEAVDLEKVYQQACQMNDEVRSILAKRSTAAPARGSGPSPAVLRARRAASSVRGDSTPDGATVPKDDSIRASIEAAFENTRV